MKMTSIEDLESNLVLVDEELCKLGTELSKLRAAQTKLQKKKENILQTLCKLKSDKISNVDWSGTSYPWSDKVYNVLKSQFKIKYFRPQQLSAINATLKGHHTLVVMPTGAGKSLCYQLPSLVNPGITVVISPLVSLMEDQVRTLKAKDISATFLASSSSKEDSSKILDDLKNKNSSVKLLYVTPERLAKSKRFMHNLQKCYEEGRLQRIAIDEVHCCSQWGHDFRPDYKFLGILSNMFKGVPILGLTATATSHVLSDVQKILNIQGCLVIKSTFNRPNLFYKILAKPTSQDECITMLEKLLKYRYKGETGIIYTNSIKDCEDISNGLRKKGLQVGFYHANMESAVRSSVHTKWHEKHYQAIVATVAFGMGIDKADVRFVIHHTMSKSMENYYQESGRAGRDGQRAECITLYRMQDIFKISTMVFSSVGCLDHMYGMVKYCLNGSLCRRKIISEHFDENWGDGDCDKMCDVYCNSNPSIKEINIGPQCLILAKIIDNANNEDIKVTAQKLIDAWFLKGPVNLRHKGCAPGFSRSIGEDVVAYLLVEGYLVEDFHFTAYSTISYIKKGPNMEITNADFCLRMPVRKFTEFDLETSPPNNYIPKSNVEEIPKIKKRKSKSENDLRHKKKTKAIVID